LVRDLLSDNSAKKFNFNLPREVRSQFNVDWELGVFEYILGESILKDKGEAI